MKTYLDCIPCFFKQALEAARIAGAGQRMQKKILDELTKVLPEIPLASSPPKMGRVIYGMVRRITRKRDPYLKIKQENNQFALKMYGRLKKRIRHSPDALLMAVKLAIAGNIIDYGVKNSLDVDKELAAILDKENQTIKQENKKLFAYARFKDALKKSKTILYLADNAGETVFDRMLIEEIKRLDKDKRVIYAVKESAVINDALVEDAYACGIDKLADVISSGSDAPGTVLGLCSREFLAIYKKADMVISKGQGNFEALSSAKREVFFLFMAKCPVVAKEVGCSLGEIVLLCRLNKKSVK